MPVPLRIAGRLCLRSARLGSTFVILPAIVARASSIPRNTSETAKRPTIRAISSTPP
jgi:hypothetical protein